MAKAEQESISIPNQSKNALLEDLKKVGFTPNEAKVFMVLISLESSSAGNLVKKTGIRDSKIYQILGRLNEKGFVTVLEGIPKNYMVVHPTTPLESLRMKFGEAYKKKIAIIERLQTVLPPMYHEHEDSPKLAYIIKGKSNVLNHLNRLMNEAVYSAIVMMPNIEIYSLLESSIINLQKLNIDLKVGIYGNNVPTTDFIKKIQLITCKCFFLIIDTKVLLTISRWNTDNWYAIWTAEPSLIEVSTGYFSSPCCTYEHSNCSC